MKRRTFAWGSWALAILGAGAHFIGTAAAAGRRAGNGLIALTLRDQNGRLQIFTIKPDGGGRRQLTFEGECGRPAWSREGRGLAFMAASDARMRVAVMDADGSQARPIAGRQQDPRK